MVRGRAGQTDLLLNELLGVEDDSRKANGALPEVGGQRRRRLFRCRQRDVTIRPQKIQCVSPETGALHRGLPAELVQREVALGAYRTNLRDHVAVDVHLPLE
jgi:hypothetical protein